MTLQERTERVWELSSAAVAPLGLEVPDVVITPAGKRSVVRVLVEPALPVDDAGDTVVEPITLDQVAEAALGMQDQVGDLALEALDLLGILARSAGPDSGVDLGAVDPQPQGLDVHPQQPRHVPQSGRLVRVLGANLGDHPDRALTHLVRVPGHRSHPD